MADKGIPFSAPMVLALLDGRKTQTRRLYNGGKLPYAPGDRLYVREAWRTEKRFDDWKPSEIPPGSAHIWFECDRDNCDAHGRYRHGRFMPRWMSRLTLTVIEVRVQRLQEISEADAIAEGIERGTCPNTHEPSGWRDYDLIEQGPHKGQRHPHAIVPWKDAVRSYHSLWDSLHKDQGHRWEDNPWIVAVTFDVRQGNIDAEAA